MFNSVISKTMMAASTATILMTTLTEAAQLHYDYTESGANWEELYNYTMCGKGERQSPIDLSESTEVVKSSGDMLLQGVGYEDFKNKTADIVWDTKMIGANFESQAEFLIKFPDKSADVFVPGSFHFHAPSEHTVGGTQFDAEMHIVHTYKGTQGQLGAVIGIFFDQQYGGTQENPLLDQLWEEEGELDLGSFLS